jgi:hypothetical protein
MYQRGDTVARDDTIAASWYEKAAAKDHAMAAYRLAVLLASNAGLGRDDAATARWLKLAAKANIADAQLRLGLAYLEARGVPRNRTTAASWLRHAAERGLPAAEYELARLLERGDGVAINVEEAFRLYDNAAESGMSDAQYALAYLLSRTPAEPEHLVRGHMWANLSATAGNKEARALRTEIERRMNAAQVAEAQSLARAWYDRNTSSEDHAAQSYPAASAVTTESPTR